MSFLNIFLATGISLLASVLNVPADGACFFHCIVLQYSLLFGENIDPWHLRRGICNSLLQHRETFIPGLQMTPQEFFDSNYGLSAEKREILVNSYLDHAQRTPDTFEAYVEAMSHHNTFADNLIVAFTAYVLDINMTVFTCSRMSVKQCPTGNDDFDKLVSMGFNVSSVQNALKSKSFQDAFEQLLSDPSANFVPAPTSDVWRGEQYGSGKTVSIVLINDYDHFQLVTDLEKQVVLPDVEIDDEDLQPSPHHSHHEVYSFGHTQRSLREDFFNKCHANLSGYHEPPQDFRIVFSIPRGTDVSSLIDSFLFPDLAMVRYRIYAIMFDDTVIISHSGNIEELSHRKAKEVFFPKIWAKISTCGVYSVHLQKC